ncbi:hypothetical protein K488DRAFT_42913 [Vararia minispora EC-137]|uniref:Uncharacterized protein n=1 Tax=Vararia minispora EC-137 TaxID=1314806 RepID=A0ACB8QUT2_9AGAM|nr:hypothetical protein K488DRAFT_42913 [Vararia minispora EC-137]
MDSERSQSFPSDDPTELVVFFERLAQIPLTPLYRQLHQIDSQEIYLRRFFSAARHVLVEVGACASELVWRRAAADIEASIVEPDEDEEPDPAIPQTKERLAKLEVLNAIKHWDFSMPNLDPSSRGFNVTPKFLKLAQVLKSCQPYGDTFRGLVIVRKKAVAQEMVDLIRTVEELDFLRPQLLVGRKLHQNHQAQIDLFELFEQGTCNLIIATKRAEDLDIPPATLVVRYDLFDSHLSYGYSRARTSGKESHLVHMIPRNSDIHRRRLTEIIQVTPAVEEWLHSLSAVSPGRIPPRSIRETNDPYISDSEDEDTPGSFITDPTTSGRIRLQNAVSIIYRFASTLPSDDVTFLFDYEEVDGTDDGRPQYICSVRLPSIASVRPITSPPSVSVAHTRRMACYLLCQELFQRGLLDYRLFPRPFDSAAPHATAALPPKGTNQNASGTRCYPAKSPDFWMNVLREKPERLYPTVICPTVGSGFAPVAIVTRMPLPPFSDFNLFDRGIPMRIHLRRGQGFDTNERQRHLLWRFTTRITRTIQNKPFTCEQDRTPYYLVPLHPTSKWATRFGPDGEVGNNDVWNLPTVADDISWDLVELVGDKFIMGLRTESLEALKEDMKDAVIQDRWIEFTRRYYVTAVRADLSPMSKPEAGTREETYENFLGYVAEHRQNFEGIEKEDQPMIEVTRVLPVQNLLHPAYKHVSESVKLPTKYLIPELCAKSTIPASVFRTALLIPSITHKIDALLLVKEINAMLFDNSIDEHQLLSAICAPSASMEDDYERLELLGDAYLKYLSSVYVFVTNPSQHEGALHSARLRIISNRALLINGDNAGLPPFIQAKAFVAKLWQPPNFVVQPPPQSNKKKEAEEKEKEKPEVTEVQGDGERKDEKEGDIEPGEIAEDRPMGDVQPEPPTTSTHDSPDPELPTGKRSRKKRVLDSRNVNWLGDKAVADVAEAIIGAAYKTGGREVALRASKALCIAIPRVDRWADFAKQALAPPPEVTGKLRAGTVEAIEKILGHRFMRPHLLAQALTHASIQGYEMTCYERLEFIGDAILDFTVIRHIYDRDTTLSPGALTLLKGAMVSNSALAAVCVEAQLHEHIMFESLSLANSMDAYAAKIKAKQREEYELAAQEGRLPGQYWLDVDAPKILSDVVESIIGAIYISDNFNPEGCITFYDRILKPFFDKHVTLQTLAHHPTKTLFELFQTYGCQRFEMLREQVAIEIEPGRLVTGTQCEIIVHDVVLARGEDMTSANAAKRTSIYALDALEGDAGFMTRTCDCRAQTQAKRSQKKALERALFGFDDEDIEKQASNSGSGDAMDTATAGADNDSTEVEVKAKVEE